MTTTNAGAVRELELRVPGPDRDLAATLTLPTGAGLFPAAVLISGSGPVDRNSNGPRLAMDATRQLAAALARAGVASLRYDKRGVAASRLLRDGTTEDKNGWKRVGLFDNADDVSAACAALAGRVEVDPARLFLVGHSEGATLATLTAARLLAAPAGPHPAGVVLLAGGAKPGDATLRWQAAALAPTLPAPLRLLLKLLRTDLVRQVSRNHDKVRATATDVARIGGARLNAKWLREFLAYDPRPDLGRLKLPVLAITGSKDLQVDPADLATIAELVPGPVETWYAPDVTHLLRTQPGTPSLRAYKQEACRPVAPAVLDRITSWLTGNLAADESPMKAVSRLGASPADTAEDLTQASPGAE